MSYQPDPMPTSLGGLLEFLSRELWRLANFVRDDAPTVQYLTSPVNQGSLTAGVSANWRHALGNVLRVSTSATITLTGIAHTLPNRVVTYINVGTGVLHFKSEASESSASHRFALAASFDVSQNASCTLWYDGVSFRHRCIGRT
jgi:hypothetical protein